MNNLGNVNVAVQVLPMNGDKNAYAIVDSAIAAIEASGLKYFVSPFETTIEGPYDEVMQLVKEVQLVCFREGAKNLLTNLKIQSASTGQVTISDKMEKYE